MATKADSPCFLNLLTNPCKVADVNSGSNGQKYSERSPSSLFTV